MRPAWAINNLTDEVLRTSAQYGVKDIIVYAGPGARTIPGTSQPLDKPRAEYIDYLAMRRRVESCGLRLVGCEGGFSLNPKYRDVVLGGPRRDELIEEIIAEVRDMARAGIPIWGYQWMPNSVWRTPPAVIRGGAFATAFDYQWARGQPNTHDREYTDEEVWAALEYWLRAVTPVAEEEGIRLGIHPDDPPVPSLGGIPRILRSFDAYKRLMDIYPSDCNAIEFCQGTFSEMNEDIYEMVRYFAERKKILYVHFRNVSSQVPSFREEFINTGYVDMVRALRVYRDAGYDGVFMDDHCPILDGDVDFPGNLGGYRSRIFAQGYIQGALDAVKSEPKQPARRASPARGTGQRRMGIGIGQGGGPTPDFLRFAAQIGAENIVLNQPSIPVRNGRWELADLVNLRSVVESYGLKLAAIENTPITMRDHIIWGGPRRDEQMENMVHTIRNIARAGIPIYSYSWKYPRIYRTGHVDIRAGAMGTAFDAELARQWPDIEGAGISEEEAWGHLEYWVRAITPVAEEEGIRLAIHPNDPPVPTLCGVPQLFRSFDAYKRLIELDPSDANGILFCQGTVAEMAGEDVYEMVRYFGQRKKIAYVHFRNVSGQVPKFYEEFINTGYVDMVKAMRTYHEVGFDGFFMDDHVPRTVNDTEYGHRARAFANGYIQALLDAVQGR